MKKALLTLLLIGFTIAHAQTVNSFSFNINGTAPVGLTTALNAASQRWNSYVGITVPIKVNLFFLNSSSLPFSAITLANGRTNFVGAPIANYTYPTSLANQLAGTELNAGEYDMDIYVNLATNFYFGTGNPTATQTDFVSTIMHEIGHGLGFYSTGYVNSSGVGSFGNIPSSALFPLTPSFGWHGQDGYPAIYDKYIVKQSLLNLVGLAPNNTAALGDSIRLHTNYFSGPVFANASNSGNPVKLSGGTGAYTLGVDLLHLHTSVCNSIMSYCWGSGDTVRKPAAWEMGILKEIGWNPSVVGVHELNVTNACNLFPNPAQSYFDVSGSEVAFVDVYNLNGQLMKHVVNALKTKSMRITTEELSAGLYFISVQTATGQVSRKLVITEN